MLHPPYSNLTPKMVDFVIQLPRQMVGIVKQLQAVTKYTENLGEN